MSKERYQKEIKEFEEEKELIKEYGVDLFEDISDMDMDNEEKDEVLSIKNKKGDK